ncbi:hypothetical protein C8R46DRAFT_471592 [Mycena filopes]|nr:hypothetical protein C8R46DRAFT_471592 [Mycena filopes]
MLPRMTMPPPRRSAAWNTFAHSPCSITGVAGGTAQFFRHLELPQLEFLEYVTHSVEELPITPLLRSPHQLRRLSLNIQHLSSDALIECLRLVPDLHGLFIRHDPFDFRGSPPSRDGTLWAAFNPTTETLDDVLCPQLRSVKFTDFTGLSDDMILAFIRARTESRLAGIAHLTKFHAHLNRAVSVDIPAALRQAVADGLDLSLDYDDDRVQYSPSQENEMHAPRGEVQFDGWRSVW